MVTRALACSISALVKEKLKMTGCHLILGEGQG